MDYLPVFIQLRSQPGGPMGQSVVVVGGGRVAVRKVDLLRRSGARITVVAPELREELHKLIASGAIQHIAARFVAEHLDREAAILVIAATDDHEVNVAVSQAARARRIPVNVVDDPALSTFIFPAIVDRSPIIVAVSSGGESPVLARRVREQIEALLPEKLGALARFMGNDARPCNGRSASWRGVPSGSALSAAWLAREFLREMKLEPRKLSRASYARLT